MQAQAKTLVDDNDDVKTTTPFINTWLRTQLFAGYIHVTCRHQSEMNSDVTRAFLADPTWSLGHVALPSNLRN